MKVVYYNEEKRREIYIRERASKIKIDFKKNVSYEVENKLRKTINLNGRTKNNYENIKLEDNIKNKRKNKIIRNISNIRYNIIFIKVLIIIKLFIQILSYNKNILIKFQFSNITLRINGTGNQKVFSSLFSNHPNFVYINKNKTDTVHNSYDLDQIDNIVELIWNNSINNSQNMFYRCTNIIEIDLSNFDTSKVTNMYSMLSNCTSITSLNLTNFNTSQVTYMGYMFRDCTSLTSLDLSNFNTSQATNMSFMFFGCTNLEYINLQNFDES